MQKTLIFFLASIIVAVLSGCETEKAFPLTPDKKIYGGARSDTNADRARGGVKNHVRNGVNIHGALRDGARSSNFVSPGLDSKDAKPNVDSQVVDSDESSDFDSETADSSVESAPSEPTSNFSSQSDPNMTDHTEFHNSEPNNISDQQVSSEQSQQGNADNEELSGIADVSDAVPPPPGGSIDQQREQDAAVLLQSCARRMAGHRQVAEREQRDRAVVLFQSRVRGRVGREQAAERRRQREQQRDRAAVLIQSLGRGRAERHRQQERAQAAILIQRLGRGLAGRRRVSERRRLHCAAVRIQKLARGKAVRRQVAERHRQRRQDRAAVLIQKLVPVVRGRAVRREAAERHRQRQQYQAALRIQRLVRGKAGRREAAERRRLKRNHERTQAAARIQALVHGWAVRRKQRRGDATAKEIAAEINKRLKEIATSRFEPDETQEMVYARLGFAGLYARNIIKNRRTKKSTIPEENLFVTTLRDTCSPEYAYDILQHRWHLQRFYIISLVGHVEFLKNSRNGEWIREKCSTEHYTESTCSGERIYVTWDNVTSFYNRLSDETKATLESRQDEIEDLNILAAGRCFGKEIGKEVSLPTEYLGLIDDYKPLFDPESRDALLQEFNAASAVSNFHANAEAYLNHLGISKVRFDDLPRALAKSEHARYLFDYQIEFLIDHWSALNGDPFQFDRSLSGQIGADRLGHKSRGPDFAKQKWKSRDTRRVKKF